MFDAPETAHVVIQGDPSPTGAAVGLPFKPLTRQQVSEILGVSVRTLDNWQKASRMPRSVTIEGKVYWHPEIFYSWLDRKLRSADHEGAGVPVAERDRATAAEKSLRQPERLSSATRAISRNRSLLASMAAGGR